MITNIVYSNSVGLTKIGDTLIVSPTNYTSTSNGVYTQDTMTIQLRISSGYNVHDIDLIHLHKYVSEIHRINFFGVGNSSTMIYVPISLMVLPKRNQVMGWFARCNGYGPAQGSLFNTKPMSCVIREPDLIDLTCIQNGFKFVFGGDSTYNTSPCCVTTGDIYIMK